MSATNSIDIGFGMPLFNVDPYSMNDYHWAHFNNGARGRP